MTGILGGLIGSSATSGVVYIGYVAGGASSADVTVSLTPLNLREGDLVLVGTAADAGLVGLLEAGYTAVNSDFTDVPDYLLSYKFMGAIPDTSVTVDGNTPNPQISVLVSAFRNVRSVGESAEASGTSGNPDSPSITTTTNNNMIVAYGFLDDDNITSLTAPTNFTSIGESSIGTGGNVAGSSTVAAYYKQVTAGSINPATFTTDGSDAWWAVTVALRPA